MAQIMNQARLRESARSFIARRMERPAGAWPRFGRDLTLLETDAPDGCLDFSCSTDSSMSNPLGVVHGGITAALVDTCMGVTCAAQCGGAATPTITMTVNYARPVPLDAQLRVRARTVRVGGSTGQMTAEVFLAQNPEEPLVTASGVYAVRREGPGQGQGRSFSF